MPESKPEEYPVAEAVLVATAQPSFSQQGQHGFYRPVMKRDDENDLATKVAASQLKSNHVK